MEEIKVGEYIRTKDGIIRKYHHSDIHYGDVLIRTDKKDIIYDFEIVKHAENIIDLIEEGDYVNGKLVSNVDKVERKNFIEWEDGDMYSTEIPNDKFIKDIVTKEQFNQMKYIVGE